MVITIQTTYVFSQLPGTPVFYKQFADHVAWTSGSAGYAEPARHEYFFSSHKTGIALAIVLAIATNTACSSSLGCGQMGCDSDSIELRPM